MQATCGLKMLHHNFHVPAVQQPATEYQTMETQDSETKRSPGIGFTDRTVSTQRKVQKWFKFSQHLRHLNMIPWMCMHGTQIVSFPFENKYPACPDVQSFWWLYCWIKKTSVSLCAAALSEQSCTTHSVRRRADMPSQAGKTHRVMISKCLVKLSKHNSSFVPICCIAALNQIAFFCMLGHCFVSLSVCLSICLFEQESGPWISELQALDVCDLKADVHSSICVNRSHKQSFSNSEDSATFGGMSDL